MAYIEVEIPKAPDRYSLLDKAAYELLRLRLQGDEDPGPELEAASPEAIEDWLLEQAEELGAIFQMHAEGYQGTPFAQFTAA